MMHSRSGEARDTLAHQLRVYITQNVDSGEWREGHRIPNELDLAEERGLSRNQVRLVLAELEHDGYIERFRRRGSFVAPSERRRKQLGVKGFRIVGMACVPLSSHYKRIVLDTFAAAAHAHGYQAAMYFLDPDAESEQRFLRDVRKSGIDGLAIWLRDTSPAMRTILTDLKASGFPIVFCDRYLPNFDADTVATDNVAMGDLLTNRLIQNGHTRIAFVTHWRGITATEDRMQGYRRALLRHGIAFHESMICSFDPNQPTEDVILSSLLARRNAPTAFVCSDDVAALATIRILEELGHRIPQDVAIAAVDDDRALSNARIPVLLASQQGNLIGQYTAEALIRRIANPDCPTEFRLINPLFDEEILTPYLSAAN